MPRIAKAEIERVKAEIDLAALIRGKGIELHRHGSKDLAGRCPFHEGDDTPSMIVTPAKNLFHCMACGAAGSSVDFLMKHDGLSFRHAFEQLAGPEAKEAYKASAKVKASTTRKLAAPVEPQADDAELMEQVADYYHERLMQNTSALEYLEKRGLRDDAMLKHFKIGFSDRTLGLRVPFKNRKAGKEMRSRLTQLGIYRESGHEHFPGCVVVPIRQGGVIREMYGRAIEKRKSKIDHLYLPGPHVGIFNEEALNESEVILCEAVFDALSLWKHGVRNVTTIFGTEGFTDELFEALLKKNVKTVRLAYDNDEAGERAAKRDAERLAARGIEVYRIRLPWGMDVNDAVLELEKTHPGEPLEPHLRRLIAGAEWIGSKPTVAAVPSDEWIEADEKPASEEAAKNLADEPEHDHAQPFPSLVAEELAAKKLAADNGGETAKKKNALQREGDYWWLRLEGREYRISGLEKCSGVDSIRVTLRLKAGDYYHSDSVDLCRDQDRRRFVQRAGEETNLSPDLLKRDLGRLLGLIEQHLEERAKKGQEERPTPAGPGMSPSEKREALEFLKQPNLLDRVMEAVELGGIVGERTNILAGYLSCVSRKLDRPLAVIIQSTSAAGKSTLMEAILSFFPEEERIKYSAMTGQSLYYLGETNLRHKILAIVEEEGAEKASYALKLLQSEGELTIASTGKDPQTGRMMTQEYHVEGPVMIFLTTTAIDIDEELMNRCIVLTVDESAEQTARIHALQRQRRTLEGLIASEQRKDVLRVMRNAQRLLEPVNIINPFAPDLTFASRRTRARRDHEKYLTLIDSIALLHQHQRERHHREFQGRAVQYIEVTLEDIEIANRIAPEILGRSLDELPPQTRRLYAEVRDLVREHMQTRECPQPRALFTRRELRQRMGWSECAVRAHVQRLENLEYVGRRAGRQGAPCFYELLLPVDQEESGSVLGLIDLEQLKGKREVGA